MAVARYVLPVLLILTSPIIGQSSASPPANPVAEKVWQLFLQSRFDTPIHEWVGVESTSTGLDCRQFHSDSYDVSVDGGWCYRCVREDQAVRAEWVFYALSLDPPLACRAERFQATASGFPEPVLEAIRQELEARLSSLYGPSREPEKKFGGYGESGSAGWHNVRRWETPDIQILLYISRFPQGPLSLGLIARHHHLRDAIAAEGTPLDERLAEELGTTFPKLPPLLLEELPYPREESENEDLQTTLQSLLERAATAPSERRPALLLAADRLAGRWDVAKPPTEGVGEIRRQFGPYQLYYAWNHLGNNWVYGGDLRRRVLRDFPDTEWGEFAFILFMSVGWDDTIGCGKGSDQFREIIKRGEEFLTRHPHTSLKVDIAFMLAQAYETWWSASQASIQDSYVDRFRYHKGSAAALQKAITYYEKILKDAPESCEAGYAGWHLPRLKLGLDTGQRRFYCIYD